MLAKGPQGFPPEKETSLGIVVYPPSSASRYAALIEIRTFSAGEGPYEGRESFSHNLHRAVVILRPYSCLSPSLPLTFSFYQYYTKFDVLPILDQRKNSSLYQE